jgi:hypothetical protein
MATSGKMIEVIAAALSLPKARVTSYYSALRKAGLISTTGRGKSAHDLTSIDVARILISMLCSDSIDEVDTLTNIFKDLSFNGDQFDEYSDSQPTLEEAIAYIINAYTNHYKERTSNGEFIFKIAPSSQITLETINDKISSEITIDNKCYHFYYYATEDSTLIHPNNWDKVSKYEKFLARKQLVGMSTKRSVTHFSLKYIAKNMP